MYILFDGHMKFKDRKNNLKYVINFIKKEKVKDIDDFYSIQNKKM